MLMKNFLLFFTSFIFLNCQNDSFKLFSTAALEKNNKNYASKHQEALKNVKDEVVLFDENKTKTTLSAVLQAHKGKVIYIDFWASWCAFCRAAFPASRKLHSEFENVVFLYLSTDANFESWKAANKKEALTENSYFILNNKTSNYLRKLAIDLIPRYVLIDQNGTIVNPKAPGPDSDKTKEELNDLLKNK